MAEDNQMTGEESLTDDIKMFVGGVASLVLLIVPILVIRKLVKTIEESKPYQSLERGIEKGMEELV